MPFKSTQPDIQRASLSSRSVKRNLTCSIEYSADSCHDLGLAIRFSFLCRQEEPDIITAWLQQWHYRRADQLRSGSRGGNLPLDRVGQKIWIERRGSYSIVQP